MTQSIYSFERSELRTLQNMCEGDNEKFLNLLADIVGGQDTKIEELRNKLGKAEHRVRVLEEQASDDSWVTNPDRMGGGGWTADELDPNRGWK